MTTLGDDGHYFVQWTECVRPDDQQFTEHFKCVLISIFGLVMFAHSVTTRTVSP